MGNRKIFVIALAIVTVLALGACSSSPAAKAPPATSLDFNNLEISALQARGATTGPADGGAFFFSGAKTTLESGTYEILLSRNRAVDVRPYEYLEFEISTDNMDLLDDTDGFFPRLRTGETYTQFNGTAGLRAALANVSTEGEWAKVTVSIAASNAHERGEEIRGVLPRVDSILLRFICNSMDSIDGKIFVRNFQFN